MVLVMYESISAWVSSIRRGLLNTQGRIPVISAEGRLMQSKHVYGSSNKAFKRTCSSGLPVQERCLCHWFALDLIARSHRDIRSQGHLKFEILVISIP